MAPGARVRRPAAPEARGSSSDGAHAAAGGPYAGALAAAFEAAGVAMVLLDGSCAVVRANAAWRDLLGRPPDAGPGAVVPVHPDDRAAWHAAWEAARDGAPGRTRVRLIRADGRLRVVDVTVSAVPGEPEAPALLHAVLLDVTAQELAAAELAASEQRCRQVVDLAGEGIWMLDRDWVIRFANPAVARMLGRSVDELLGRPITEFLDAEGRERARHDRDRRQEGVSEVVQNSLVHADGHVVWVRVNATPIRDEGGRVTGSLAVLTDITHQLAMERALAEREHRYAMLVEHLPGGAVFVLDRDLRVLTAGGGGLDLAGQHPDSLIGRNVAELVPPEDLAVLVPKFAAALSGRPSGTFEYRHSPSGRVELMDAVPLTRGADGTVTQVLVASRDVTDLKHAEAQLAHLADHDPLTGLLNRRGFTGALGRHAALVSRYGPAGALLMIDIDRFKRVNDEYGHQVGDQVIVRVAECLRDTLRGSDLAARLGGDEFAVLLSRGGREQVRAVAERILRTVRADRRRPVTLSMGIALFDDPTGGGEGVLVNADRAMYDAKAAGRDRYVFYDA